MGRKIQRDDAGSMLATVLVIIAGTMLLVFICAVANSDAGAILMGVTVGLAVLSLMALVWYRYFRDHGNNSLELSLSIARNKPDDGIAAHQYEPRLVKNRHDEAEGTNQPITADEAHELRISSANTWVPSRNKSSSEEE
tara:strand:- start:124 stop:540 length:417 start_codon:yes stop_codon:yes gene_type:complete